MKRWSGLMVALLIMALATAVLPQTATKAHAQADRDWNCTIPGLGGEHYCYGSWDVGRGTAAQVCITFATYGTTYPLGVYPRENGTNAILGSSEMKEGDCRTLWSNNGSSRSVYLSIDSRSFAYQQELRGTFDTYFY